jgi:predicted MFS family arabinose efflux permease
VPALPRRLVPVFAISAGAAAANLYYAQPLLVDLRADFHAAPGVAGWVPTLAQVGYALGMGLVVPLGDVLARRPLILRLTALTTALLCAAPFSPSLTVLAALHLLIGLCTCVPQLLVPLAADLAPPEERGRVVGTVMSGLLVGILLSRTFAGFVGDAAGWKAVFWAGAAMNAVVWLLLRTSLPVEPPRPHVPYGELLRSCFTLLRRFPDLRLHSALGGLAFAAFSAFWVTLVLQLSTLPGDHGARTAGLYGAIGVTGAIAAPLVGRLADASRGRRINAVGCALILVSYVLLWIGRSSLLLIAVAVVLLDFGTQASHINNQARIFALDPGARSRLNTVYMVTYFTGGALGSLAATRAWVHAGWAGVCATGLGLSALALLLLGVRRLAERPGAVRHTPVT